MGDTIDIKVTIPTTEVVVNATPTVTEVNITEVKGTDGINGTDGKTAYQSALDGGYSGTLEQFYIDLAKQVPTELDELGNNGVDPYAHLSEVPPEFIPSDHDVTEFLNTSETPLAYRSEIITEHSGLANPNAVADVQHLTAAEKASYAGKLSTVTTDTTLTGDGTSGSPLGVVQSYLLKTTTPSPVSSVWSGTLAQYNTIVTKDTATIYFIV